MNGILLQNKDNENLYVSEFYNNSIILDTIKGAMCFFKEEVDNLFATNEHLRKNYNIKIVKAHSYDFDFSRWQHYAG